MEEDKSSSVPKVRILSSFRKTDCRRVVLSGGGILFTDDEVGDKKLSVNAPAPAPVFTISWLSMRRGRKGVDRSLPAALKLLLRINNDGVDGTWFFRLDGPSKVLVSSVELIPQSVSSRRNECEDEMRFIVSAPALCPATCLGEGAWALA
jgi:hypothetical protein